MFNIFMNDVFCVVDSDNMFNYADDNTVLGICGMETIQTLKYKLEQEATNITRKRFSEKNNSCVYK